MGTLGLVTVGDGLVQIANAHLGLTGRIFATRDKHPEPLDPNPTQAPLKHYSPEPYKP